MQLAAGGTPPDTTAPTISSVVVAANGLTATIALSETCTGTVGFTFTVAGAVRAATVTGSGTTRTATFGSVVYQGQTVTYSCGGDGLTDAGGTPPATLTNAAATNNSTVSQPSSGGTELTDDQAQTLDYLAQMIELIAGVPRFKASALSILGISDGADVPDISIQSVALNKNVFYQVGREILALTITASGGDAPLQFAHMSYYIGFTATSATTPPAASSCTPVQPYANGSNIECRLFFGTSDGTEDIPLVALAPGIYRVWLWTRGVENLANACGQVTVI